MRTTLDIDADVLAAAKELARVQGKTAGQVLSDLARKALTTPDPAPAAAGFAEEQATRFDVPIWHTLPDRGGGVVVTPEMIECIQDEIDREDAMSWGHSADTPMRAPATGPAPERRRKRR